MTEQDTQGAGGDFSDRAVPGERLGRFWRLSGTRVFLVIIVACTTAAVAGFITSRQPAEYVSSTTLVVQDSSGSADSETLIRSMESLLTSEDLGGEVQELTNVGLTPQQIAAETTVERAPGSGVLEVSVTDTDRERSRVIAEAIVPAFSTLVEEIQPDQDASPPTFSVTRWGTGEILTEKRPPPVKRNTALGFGLGLILAGAAVLLFQQRRPPISSAGDARDAFGLPLLAVVPRFRPSRLRWNPLDMTEGILRSGAALGWPARPASIAVLGPDHEDQRSSFLVALARSLAADGTDVTIIDANVERADVTGFLDAEGRPGFLDYVSGSAPLGECVHRLESDTGPAWITDVVAAGSGDLYLVPSGSHGVESLAAVGGDAAERLVAAVAARGIAIVDMPPMPGPIPVSRLLNACDSVIAVATEFRTSVPDAIATGEAFRTLGDRPAGVVLLGGNRLHLGRPQRDILTDAQNLFDATGSVGPQTSRQRPVRRGDRRLEPPSSAARDLRPRTEDRP